MKWALNLVLFALLVVASAAAEMAPSPIAPLQGAGCLLLFTQGTARTPALGWIKVPLQGSPDCALARRKGGSGG